MIPCPSCTAVLTPGPGPCAGCRSGVAEVRPKRRPRRDLVAYWRRLPPELRCRHCQTRKAKHRRLCDRCGRDPAIRCLYPTSKFARRAEPDTHATRPLPAEPTDALPGTEDKLRVLADRAARREQLHHPRDVSCRLRWRLGRIA